MTLFNTHHGQMRPVQSVGGIPTQMGYRQMTPKKALQMLNLKLGETVEYKADALGVMEITFGPHVRNMMNLGYPILVGVIGERVAMDDLLFPRPQLGLEDPYWKAIRAEVERDG